MALLSRLTGSFDSVRCAWAFDMEDWSVERGAWCPRSPLKAPRQIIRAPVARLALCVACILDTYYQYNIE